MGRVVHFEIHADDPDRASLFYASVFGWQITKWEGPWDYWLISTGEGPPGIDGGIVHRRGERPDPDSPCNSFVCTVVVDSIDAAMKKVEEVGGKIVIEKREIPSVGWNAYAHDTEGNVFGMLQPIRT